MGSRIFRLILKGLLQYLGWFAFRTAFKPHCERTISFFESLVQKAIEQITKGFTWKTGVLRLLPRSTFNVRKVSDLHQFMSQRYPLWNYYFSTNKSSWYVSPNTPHRWFIWLDDWWTKLYQRPAFATPFKFLDLFLVTATVLVEVTARFALTLPFGILSLGICTCRSTITRLRDLIYVLNRSVQVLEHQVSRLNQTLNLLKDPALVKRILYRYPEAIVWTSTSVLVGSTLLWGCTGNTLRLPMRPIEYGPRLFVRGAFLRDHFLPVAVVVLGLVGPQLASYVDLKYFSDLLSVPREETDPVFTHIVGSDPYFLKDLTHRMLENRWPYQPHLLYHMPVDREPYSQERIKFLERVFLDNNYYMGWDHVRSAFMGLEQLQYHQVFMDRVLHVFYRQPEIEQVQRYSLMYQMVVNRRQQHSAQFRKIADSARSKRRSGLVFQHMVRVGLTELYYLTIFGLLNGEMSNFMAFRWLMFTAQLWRFGITHWPSLQKRAFYSKKWLFQVVPPRIYTASWIAFSAFLGGLHTSWKAAILYPTVRTHTFSGGLTSAVKVVGSQVVTTYFHDFLFNHYLEPLTEIFKLGYRMKCVYRVQQPFLQYMYFRYIFVDWRFFRYFALRNTIFPVFDPVQAQITKSIHRRTGRDYLVRVDYPELYYLGPGYRYQPGPDAVGIEKHYFDRMRSQVINLDQFRYIDMESYSEYWQFHQRLCERLQEPVRYTSNDSVYDKPLPLTQCARRLHAWVRYLREIQQRMQNESIMRKLVIRTDNRLNRDRDPTYLEIFNPKWDSY